MSGYPVIEVQEHTRVEQRGDTFFVVERFNDEPIQSFRDPRVAKRGCDEWDAILRVKIRNAAGGR